MGKHVERTAQTKQALIEAFWELYVETKIEKITVKAVTDKAGFYRSTFYEYFPDVYAILEAIEMDILARHRQAMEEIFQSKNITEAQEKALAFCQENIACLAVLVGPNGDPKFRTRVKEHIRSALHDFLHVDADNPRIQLTIEIVSSAIISLMVYWYENQKIMTLPEAFSIGMDIMKNGLITLSKDLDIPFLKR